MKLFVSLTVTCYGRANQEVKLQIQPFFFLWDVTISVSAFSTWNSYQIQKVSKMRKFVVCSAAIWSGCIELDLSFGNALKMHTQPYRFTAAQFLSIATGTLALINSDMSREIVRLLRLDRYGNQIHNLFFIVIFSHLAFVCRGHKKKLRKSCIFHFVPVNHRFRIIGSYKNSRFRRRKVLSQHPIHCIWHRRLISSSSFSVRRQKIGNVLQENEENGK